MDVPTRLTKSLCATGIVLETVEKSAGVEPETMLVRNDERTTSEP